jgi:hypothetical protein
MVSGMFDSQRVLARASEDAPAGHIGPFARSLREQGYTLNSIHGQVLRALWLVTNELEPHKFIWKRRLP